MYYGTNLPVKRWEGSHPSLLDSYLVVTVDIDTSVLKKDPVRFLDLDRTVDFNELDNRVKGNFTGEGVGNGNY